MESHEQRLIDRTCKGDTTAFRELVEGCQETIFRLALELTGDWDDAEDLSQQVFIKVYRALPRFRGEAKIMSWMYRILMNTYIDHTRKDQARGWVMDPSVGHEDDPPRPELFVATAAEDNPETCTTAGMMQTHIDRALKSLAPQQRSVFIMRHYHDLPLKEIARILGLSTGAVKSQLFRAIRRLQKELSFYKAELGLEDRS